MLKTFVIACTLISIASAHSWLACADYARESDEQWDHTQCRAYPRGAFQSCKASGNNDLSNFGKECEQSQNGKAGCHKPMTSPISAGYSTAYPMAKYSQGQRVCLAWPAKNHAAGCGNAYIPDNGIQLEYSQVNPSADPSQGEFDSKKITPFGNGVHVNGQVDMKGFQNCSKFCDNTANAFCSGCFNVPSDLAPGMYVFQWSWFFNGPGDSYRTCYDVEVVASGTPGAPAPANTPGSSPPPSTPTTPSTPGSTPTTPNSPSPSSPSTPTTPGTDNLACPIGSRGCKCTTGGSCDSGLTCVDQFCLVRDANNGEALVSKIGSTFFIITAALLVIFF